MNGVRTISRKSVNVNDTPRKPSSTTTTIFIPYIYIHPAACRHHRVLLLFTSCLLSSVSDWFLLCSGILYAQKFHVFHVLKTGSDAAAVVHSIPTTTGAGTAPCPFPLLVCRGTAAAVPNRSVFTFQKLVLFSNRYIDTLKRSINYSFVFKNMQVSQSEWHLRWNQQLRYRSRWGWLR